MWQVDTHTLLWFYSALKKNNIVSFVEKKLELETMIGK